MERAVQLLAVIHLLTIGLSHVLAPRAWADFFVGLRERGQAGVFVVAFMSLWFGSIVVAFHPVWSGIPVVLTLLGWAQVLKAFRAARLPPGDDPRLAVPAAGRGTYRRPLGLAGRV